MKTATLVRKITGCNGDARLYKLSHPLAGNKFVIVSAIGCAFDTGVSETFIFPAYANGTSKSMSELKGSQRNTMSHSKALHDAGYIIKGDTK